VEKQTLELLKELAEAFGVAGHESEVRARLRERLEGYATIEQDRLGSIVFRRKGGPDRPRVMIPGHMDEIGFMVRLIDEKGFIRFATLGGWFEQNVLSQRVLIRTAKGDVPGVTGCKPPHLLETKEREQVVKLKEMFIDVGAKDKAETESFGIRPGDPIMPFGPFQVLRNGKTILSKALDDRVGCAVFAETLRRLGRQRLPCAVYGVGTVQEELGLRGARTSAHVVDPDVCIVADVGIAGDTPGIKPEEVIGDMGKGPVIHLCDAGMVPNLRLRDLTISVAQKENIPYQLTVLERGATDGGAIHVHLKGVPSIFIGAPTRYVHSHAGIMHMDDFENAVRLTTSLLLKLDRRTVASLSA
jgi:endoglucanase